MEDTVIVFPFDTLNGTYVLMVYPSAIMFLPESNLLSPTVNIIDIQNIILDGEDCS